ncbi:MAG TPA: hypothetical protein VHV55_17935 [Pirellulales bacterium]|jgi:hypothetical protein|nr:hypothetical protein [Pirellulales bacterium]
MTLKERLPKLLEMRRGHIATLRSNAADPAKDRDGCSSSAVLLTLRFIGVAEFVVSGNVAVFRQCLSEAARIKLSHFERRDAGDAIDDSYVAMLSYQGLFDALAARDLATAEHLAQRMGGRPSVELKHDHPFDYCFGYALKAFVERRPDAMAEWSPRFSATCSTAENADFVGYSMFLSAILAGDAEMAREGLSAIAQGHKRQSKRGGVFKDTVDETLCVWGVGIANLGRRDGLPLKGLPPLIPQELLV